MIPAFLLSFRLLVNPTHRGLILYENGTTSGFLSTIMFFTDYIRRRPVPKEPREFISQEEKTNEILSYKEQIKSFYFSFIGATLILLFLFLSLKAMETHGSYNIISEFSPTMNPLALVLMVIAEIVAIFILTIVGELYLKWAEPIDQR